MCFQVGENKSENISVFGAVNNPSLKGIQNERGREYMNDREIDGLIEKKSKEIDELFENKFMNIPGAEEAMYIHKLNRCLKILLVKPPKRWNEWNFIEAKAKAQIIKNRLAIFVESRVENDPSLKGI